MRKLLFLLLLVAVSASAQTYNMQNGSFTTCSGTFYDSGGAGGNYAANETYTLTFCPSTPGSYVRLTFTNFNVEGDPYDYMTIYNGPNTSAPVLANFGIDSPLNCNGGVVASTAASGCLTIRFVSDGSLQYGGWAANISCATTQPPSDNQVCAGANPFCADAGPLQFANNNDGGCVSQAPAIVTTNSCLFDAPNPAWYFLEVGVAGNINLTISQTTGPNNTGLGLDVDYVIWGPFTNTAAICSSFNLGSCAGDHNCTGNIVDCSYSDQPIENATIPNAQIGQTYLVLITNYDGDPGYVTMTQTNAGSAGAGATDCSIVCPTFAGTNPTTCGGTNGSITISGLDPNTLYTVNYLDDGTPVSTTLTSNASGTATITGLNAGNYTNLITNYAGCSSALGSVTLTSASAPLLGGLSAANATVCSGANAVFQLNGTAGATVTYTINGGGTQTVLLNGSGNGTVTVTGVTANTTITLSQISLSGCNTPLTNTATVTVSAQPTASISYAGPYCNQTTAQLVTLTGTGAYTSGAFTSAAGLSLNGTTGAITPSASTPGNYVVTYTIPASGSCAAVVTTANVSITTAATASLSYTGPFCTTETSAQNPTLTGTGTFTAGTYASATGLSINATTGAITPSTSTPGNYVVTYTIPATGSCTAVTATANVTITGSATANLSYAGPFCISLTTPQNPTLTGTDSFTGGSYTSTTGLSINGTTGAITPSTSTPGNYVVTYTIPATGSCTAVTATANVTITGSATANLSYAGPFCISLTTPQNPTLTGTGSFTGGSFTSTTGLSINGTTGDITPSTSTPGNYVVTYTIAASGSCAAVVATANVSITAPATANISYAGPFCTSQTSAQNPTLTGTESFTGGSFTSTTGLSINGTTGDITPSTSTPGNYVVTYTIAASGSCAAVVATANVSITAPETANISYAGPFCTSQTSAQNPTLTGTGSFTGGSYTSTTGLSINGTTGDITPSTSTPGNYVVTYTIAASGSCAAVVATANVSITAPATANISYAGPFCTSQTSAQNPTLTGTGSFTGGGFTSTTGLSINGTTGDITPSTSTPGNYVVTYTIAASGSCAAVVATANVTITAPATANISYAGPFCTSQTSAQSPTLTGTGSFTGGSFTSTTGLSINGTTGDITPSTSTPGNYVVTYTIAASGSCAAVVATANVSITAPATANISYGGPFCTSQTSVQNPTLTGTGSFTGGSFTSTTGLSINGTTGDITPSTSTPGNYVVTYTIAASGPCAAVVATANVVINEQPTVTIGYSGPFCGANTAGQPPIVIGTGMYWTGTYTAPSGLAINASTGVITPWASAPGNYLVTYTITAAGSCTAVVATANVTIIEPPTGVVSYAGPFCTLQTTGQLPTVTGTGLFAPLVFGGAPGLALNGLTGEITPSASLPGTYTVTYAGPGVFPCAAVMGSVSVTIVAPATANISYAAPFCTSQTSAQNPTLTGTGSFTGGSFTSTTGLSINATTGDITPSSSTPGNYVVTYTIAVSGPCAAVTTTANVTIVAPATANISYAGPFCTSQTSVQNPTLTGTGSFTGGSYTSTTGLSIDGTTGAINPSTSTPGNYVVTYTIAASGPCAAVTTTANVSIVAPATVSISYGGPYCTSLTAAQAVVRTGTGLFTTGTYTSAPGLALNAVSGAVNPSASTPGTYTVTYTIPAAGPCGVVTATTSVTINETPVVTASTLAQAICDGDATAINLSSTVTGTQFSWTVVMQNAMGASNGSGNQIVQTLQPTTNIPGRVLYTITPATADCTGASITVVVTVNPLPKPTLQGGTICRSVTTGLVTRTLMMNAGLNDSQYSFQWFHDGGLIPLAVRNSYEADDSGIFSVIATNTATGCVSLEVSAIVTEADMAEVAVISGIQAFVENPQIGVDVVGAGDYTYQLDNGAWQSSNVFTVAQIGTHTIRVTDAYGCTNIEKEFTLIGYPKFFTPNNDGYNDRWNIWSLGDQSAKIAIFDRYGKLLKYIATAGEGWDGTHNGQPMPATDYWFSVEFLDNGVTREFRSHFSLKR